MSRWLTLTPAPAPAPLFPHKRGEKLPWQGLGVIYREKNARNFQVGKAKQEATPHSLTAGTKAAPLEDFVDEALLTGADREPNYDRLRLLLAAPLVHASEAFASTTPSRITRR